jgi:hypothetical protein
MYTIFFGTDAATGGTKMSADDVLAWVADAYAAAADKDDPQLPTRIYRALARRVHPDKGGDAMAFARLRECTADTAALKCAVHDEVSRAQHAQWVAEQGAWQAQMRAAIDELSARDRRMERRDADALADRLCDAVRGKVAPSTYAQYRQTLRNVLMGRYELFVLKDTGNVLTDMQVHRMGWDREHRKFLSGKVSAVFQHVLREE